MSLQNPYKFFPDERFGDESPILALRQVGRCRVNSSPAMDSMFTELEGLAGFHPPLPPPPPPYHPPATPCHAQLKGAWRPRMPMPTPTRSFSYPCNRTLLQRHAATKHSSSDYSSVPRPQPPDCTGPQAMGRALVSDQQVVGFCLLCCVCCVVTLFLPQYNCRHLCWDNVKLNCSTQSQVVFVSPDPDEHGAGDEGVYA